jgi:hypothetical protein
MPNAGGWALALVLGLGSLGVIAALGVRKARKSMAPWVVDQLSDPTDRVTLRLSGEDRAWNPAKPLGVHNPLFGPGTAIYRRERRADGDVIHLDFTAKGATSAVQQSGPIPDSVLAGSNPRARRRLSS